MAGPQEARENTPNDAGEEARDDGDLTDMLSELRVLPPTAQLLSAFLITVPFSAGFAAIAQSEKTVFFTTFVLSIVSVVLLSGPAIQHRVMRPLQDRRAFKKLATRQIVAGSAALSLALVCASQLVLTVVYGHTIANRAATIVALLISLMWWVLPYIWGRHKEH
jgi:4-hydroxybenzoate polyprenyltransferase